MDFLLQTHLQTCACRMTPCPNPHCDVTMEKRLVDDHVTNTCQWRMVQCGYCGENHAKRDEEVIIQYSSSDRSDNTVVETLITRRYISFIFFDRNTLQNVEDVPAIVLMVVVRFLQRKR